MIKHCLVRKTNSNKFTAEAIQTNEKPGVFHVVKASRGKHIVEFGTASGEGTPSCSCKDWTRWHIPCKHFFAAFRVKPEWSWNTLPKQYTESAYLSTDNEALVAYFSSQGVPEEDIPFPHLKQTWRRQLSVMLATLLWMWTPILSCIALEAAKTLSVRYPRGR